MNELEEIQLFTAKDLETDQEVRWCPGCGDYAILKAMQMTLPSFNRPKNEFVFISGIGCSSRFPYYMNTYGMHSIHGRAAAIASGLKITRPELSVWVITGDGDSLSIGGNHLIHALRRNIDLNILLFNNQIYGLTKGQYSPSSEFGKITKSSPIGTVENPFNVLNLCIGAGSTFVARTMDKDIKHQQKIYSKAYHHKGTSLVEIYQNCNVFNDGAFDELSDKNLKHQNVIFLENGEPMLFNQGTQGLEMIDNQIRVVNVNEANKLMVHDEKNLQQAFALSNLTYQNNMPTPFGIIYQNNELKTYEEGIIQQVQSLKIENKKEQFKKLLTTNHSWKVNQ